MRNRLLTAAIGVLTLVTACSSARSVDAPTTTPTTVPACPPQGALTEVAAADPDLMSALLGADIRTGAHPCFERVVIELMGTGQFPGWRVGYVNDPVPRGASGETVFLLGDATLQVRMGMWMQTMQGEGYQGDIQLFPTTVDHVLELRLVENYEGVTVWAIGLDHQYPFAVTVLDAPERLVIDVYTG